MRGKLTGPVAGGKRQELSKPGNGLARQNRGSDAIDL